ncbi:MAG: hypothetical protein Q4E76_07155 [Tissierellia bacterium]|nr:hypothetical protein [Tissierellia bacterium]
MKAKQKDLLREIWDSWPRFFGIFSLVGLGVFVVVGLLSAGPMLRRTADTFTTDNGAYHVSLEVQEGLLNEDLRRIEAQEGLQQVEYFHGIGLRDGDNRHIYVKDLPQKISLPILVSGRLPERAGEILLDSDLLGAYDLGETIQFQREKKPPFAGDEEELTRYEFEVVGFGNSPEFYDSAQKSKKAQLGTFDAFAMILPQDFGNSKYREAQLQYEDMEKLTVSEPEFQERALAHVAALEEDFQGRGEERFEVILSDAREELTDAQEEIDDGYTELSDAKAELEDAKDELDRGQREIADGEDELNSKTAEGRREIARQEQRLLDSRRELDAAKAEIDSGKAALKEARGELSVQKQQLEEQAAPLEAALGEISAQRKNLEGQKSQLEAERSALITRQGDLAEFGTEEERAQVAQALAQVEAQLSQIQGGLAQMAPQEEELLAQKAPLDAARQQLAQGEAQLEEQAKQLAAAEEQWAQGKAQADAAVGKIQDAKDTLASEEAKGRRKLADSRRELEEGRRDYQEGLDTYNREYDDNIADLISAQRDVDLGRDALEVLVKPHYYITPLQEDVAVSLFLDYAKRVDNLAYIFPIFFFAVALLLASTTMNRMVDEERIEIGTYKAMGYTNGEISKKYLYYGVLAGLLGGIFGAVMGNFFLGPLVAESYMAGFVTEQAVVELYPVISTVAIALGVFSIGLVVLATLRSSMGLHAAQLMRPVVPTHGGRIFMERIKPLWRRMSFLQKVTMRNLFRYKKRMILSIIGTGGSLALIFLGFGIRTSVNGLVDKQFGAITRYNTMVLYEQKLDPEEHEAYRKALQEDDTVTGIQPAYQMRGYLPKGKNFPKQEISVLVTRPEEDQGLILLRDPKTKAPLKAGAVLTQKAAKLYNVAVGEEFTFQDIDGVSYTVAITGIAEGYVGHGLFLTHEVYEEATGKEYRANTDLVASTGPLSDDYLKYDTVLSQVSTQSLKDLVSQLESNINRIVVIIVLASSLLALVVLFTLININIEERMRELSTLKVLGFYPRETTVYILRETAIHTLVGILLGYAMGKGLHLLVIATVVPDSIMLDSQVGWMNYFLPTVITLAIIVVIFVVVHRKLKDIDMVEALKAIE